MAGINTPKFEPPQNIENLKNFDIKNALANLGNDIFNAGKINRLPYREGQELKYYTENNKQNFINFLNKSLNKLEIA